MAAYLLRPSLDGIFFKYDNVCTHELADTYIYIGFTTAPTTTACVIVKTKVVMIIYNVPCFTSR